VITISMRAWLLSSEKSKVTGPGFVRSPDTQDILQALDEWQASVEERLGQAQRWISIGEALPPKETDVLLLSVGTSEICVAQIDDRGRWVSDWFDADSYVPKPSEAFRETHWMPIAQLSTEATKASSAHTWDHESQTAGGYEREPVETEE
jgi:hypothetical protein